MIYLDSAATSYQKPTVVFSAVQEAMRTMSSPGRGAYPSAMRAADTVLDCRECLADFFHVKDASQVIFTVNATHALNIAIHSLVSKGDKVVISGYEHNAVTRPLHALEADIHVARAPLFDQRSQVEAFRRALPGAKAAVCCHVSNVFGFVLPLEEIASLCRELRVPLIVDASQSAGILPLDFENLGAEFLAAPGHKGLLAPQGTGILLCRDSALPLLYGGTGTESRRQEMPDFLPERLEAGTLNVPGIAGLLAALRWLKRQGSGRLFHHEEMLMREFCAHMAENHRIRLFILPGNNCQTGLVSLQVAGYDTEAVAQHLAERGIAVRSGLHCAPLAHRTAGTLEQGTVRLSFSPFNTLKEIRHTASILTDLAR